LSRKVKILGRAIPLPAVIAGAVLLAGGGVALAAILLTTTITGATTVETVTTSNTVAVTASSVDGSQLTCGVQGSDDAKTLTINPHLKKIAGGSNATGVPVPGGNCTITIKVTNTGDTALRVDGSSGFTLPTGWTVSALSGDALAQIQPTKTAALTATLTADGNAVAGPISGQLAYTDAP
jgi:NPCBM-associated, NEW3 domain of alpha-galactosidase